MNDIKMSNMTDLNDIIGMNYKSKENWKITSISSWMGGCKKLEMTDMQ